MRSGLRLGLGLGLGLLLVLEELGAGGEGGGGAAAGGGGGVLGRAGDLLTAGTGSRSWRVGDSRWCVLRGGEFGRAASGVVFLIDDVQRRICGSWSRRRGSRVDYHRGEHNGSIGRYVWPPYISPLQRLPLALQTRWVRILDRRPVRGLRLARRRCSLRLTLRRLFLSLSICTRRLCIRFLLLRIPRSPIRL
jgi:hypothetical protein